MSQRNPTEAEAIRFALVYVIHGDISMGFRYVFPSSKAKDKTIHEKASRFHKLGKVQASIEQLREGFLANLERDSIYTMQKAFNELEEARVLARTPDRNGKVNAAAMINATMGKIKLAGLLIPEQPEEREPFAPGGVLILPEGKTKEEQWAEYVQLPAQPLNKT